MSNHGQPGLFSVYNIYLWVFINWIYNIHPLGSILLPWVHSPLGF